MENKDSSDSKDSFLDRLSEELYEECKDEYISEHFEMDSQDILRSEFLERKNKNEHG